MSNGTHGPLTALEQGALDRALAAHEEREAVKRGAFRAPASRAESGPAGAGFGERDRRFLQEIIEDGHAAGVDPAIVAQAAIAWQRAAVEFRIAVYGSLSAFEEGMRLTTGVDPRPLRWVLGISELYQDPGRGVSSLAEGFIDPETGQKIRPTREVWEHVRQALNGASPVIGSEELPTFQAALNALVRALTHDRVSPVTTDFLLHIILMAAPALAEAKGVASVLRVGSEFEGVRALGFAAKAEEAFEFKKLQKNLTQEAGAARKTIGPVPPTAAQKSQSAREATFEEMRRLEQGEQVPIPPKYPLKVKRSQEAAIDAAARRHAEAYFAGDDAEVAAAARELDDLIGRYPDAARTVAAGLHDPGGLLQRLDLAKQAADKAFRAAESELNPVRRKMLWGEARRLRGHADALELQVQMELKLAAEAPIPPGIPTKSPADLRRERYERLLEKLPVAKFEDDLSTATGNAEKLLDDLKVAPADAQAIADSGAAQVATRKPGVRVKGGKKRYVVDPPKAAARKPVSGALSKELDELYNTLLEEDLAQEGYAAAVKAGRLPKLSKSRQAELDKMIGKKGPTNWETKLLHENLLKAQIGEDAIAAARTSARRSGIRQPLSVNNQKVFDQAVADAEITQGINDVAAQQIAKEAAAREALRKAGIPDDNIRRILGPDPAQGTILSGATPAAARKGFRNWMLKPHIPVKAREPLKNAAARGGVLLRILTLAAQGDVLLWGPLMVGAALGIDFIGGKIGSARFRDALMDMLSLEKALEDALRLAEKNPANVALARDLLTKYDAAVTRLSQVLESNRRALDKTDSLQNAEASLKAKQAVLVAANAEYAEVVKPPASRIASQFTLDKIRDAVAAQRLVLTDDESALIESRRLTNWDAQVIMGRVKPFERKSFTPPTAKPGALTPRPAEGGAVQERAAPPASQKQVALIEKRVSRGETELTPEESDKLAKWNHSIGKPSFDEGALTVVEAGVILDRPPREKSSGLPGFEDRGGGGGASKMKPASLKQLKKFSYGQAEAYTTAADDARVEAYEELLGGQDPAELSEEAVAELSADPRFLSSFEMSRIIDAVENKKRGRGRGGPGGAEGARGAAGPAGPVASRNLKREWEASRDEFMRQRYHAINDDEIHRLDILIADAQNRIERLTARGY